MRKSNRAAAGAAAWKMVYDNTQQGKPSVAARVKALPRMLGARMRGQYQELSTSKIVLFLVALAYIVSPIDLVPELFIPIFGVADDVGIVVWLTAALLGETERFLHWERIGADHIEGEVVS
ncbi:MAG TPA: YkvA family protein [Thermobifida alba]|nr:YkvA family protein [Thermobifida alba]